MDTNVYVGLSAQKVLARRLDTIANNVANAGTVGFRAEGIHFTSVVSRTRPFVTTFASPGTAHVDTRGGGLVRTGNPLDVAVEGDGYLAIQTAAGLAYTRDGRMQLLATGDLVTLGGHPILDSGGAPLTVDPLAGPVEIARDGTISQQGRSAGAIGLFQLDLSQGFARFENAALVPARTPEAIVEFVGSGMVQGFVEESNVNAIMEMTNLIKVTRAFEAVSTGLERRDATMRDAIQTLGGKG